MPHAPTVIDHPLVQHKLTLMRRRETTTGEFRTLLRELSPLMLYEATRDLPLTTRRITTPLEDMDAPVIAGKKFCFVPILRAGLGMLDGMQDLVPPARVGHIGLYRDPKTLEAVQYYCKLPADIGERLAIVLDPMLATGHSASAALTLLKEHGARDVRFICLLAAQAGIDVLAAAHPEVRIYTASIDRELNDHAYIMPGLGDAGDRLFGTK
ncbi:MAG: uracil phosphoribosyltransferase [Burkholderiales bacterium]|nr:uracil phosphoribosyltransferase [Burkholderiales bacterium]